MDDKQVEKISSNDNPKGLSGNPKVDDVRRLMNQGKYSAEIGDVTLSGLLADVYKDDSRRLQQLRDSGII
jgi:hypothetical protein